MGGVSKAELNKLELEMLFLLDFRVTVSSRAFETYCWHLEKEMLMNGNGEMQRAERPLMPTNSLDDVSEISVDDTLVSSSPPWLYSLSSSPLLCLFRYNFAYMVPELMLVSFFDNLIRGLIDFFTFSFCNIIILQSCFDFFLFEFFFTNMWGRAKESNLWLWGLSIL